MSTSVVFIRSMAFLGSQLLVYPLLYQLRRLRPDDDIHVVGRDPLHNYYQHLPWVDRFVLAESHTERYRSISNDTQLVVTLHRSGEIFGFLAAARRVPVRLGIQNRRISDVLWTHSWRHDPKEYLGLANLNLLRTLQDFDPGDASRGCIRWFSNQHSGPVQLSDVVFMVGGGAGAFKRWGVRNYIDLAVRLKSLLGPDTTFTFVLGPAEADEAEFLRQRPQPDFRLMISHPIADIAYAVLNSRLVVANDCGPAHIAQNACIPYVGIFHEPNPAWFWERNQSAYVIPKDDSGSIQAISVRQVHEACKRVLRLT
jgi:ADP-heptose:LPS heptosyltransferase